jgi:hypothetical protein
MSRALPSKMLLGDDPNDDEFNPSVLAGRRWFLC